MQKRSGFVLGCLGALVASVAVAHAAGSKTSKQVEVDTFYRQRCAVCHGASGKGDGPGSGALKPPPRSFADPKWQSSVTDAEIAEFIVKGGAALQRSPAMPGYPELRSDEQKLGALVKKIRSFGP